jgi:hypothetical protein
MIIDPGQRSPRRLALEATDATPIENEIGASEISAFELNQHRMLDQQYGHPVQARTDPSLVFNCHGLVFASRRTWIVNPKQVTALLPKDGYSRVQQSEVMPGDLILYFDEYYEPTHSGIVLVAPSAANLYIPTIYSKWGKYREMIHPANRCPYAPDLVRARYYRAYPCSA